MEELNKTTAERVFKRDRTARGYIARIKGIVEGKRYFFRREEQVQDIWFGRKNAVRHCTVLGRSVLSRF
jgi:hypothetical protein